MSLTHIGITLAENGFIPDFIIRKGIRNLCIQRLNDIASDNCEISSQIRQIFFETMETAEIAPLAEMANDQHYEVPAAFFNFVLGKNRKYSSCYWPNGVHNLDDAEDMALSETLRHAELEDGHEILELGCGWGSLSILMAKRFPKSKITSVSNSNSQRKFIMDEASKLGLQNLNVITCDMNSFDTNATYDRVVSVEMFEHMRNYDRLFEKISRWLNPNGKFFMHIFCHKSVPYAFEVKDEGDWLSQYFFSGGFMPSDDTPLRFQKHLKISKQWRWDGTHYKNTANAWLKNMDDNIESIRAIFKVCYGERHTKLWVFRWRIFFMSCAELFGLRNGQEWWVSHYLFEKT